MSAVDFSQAACLGHDPEIFFANRRNPKMQTLAKAICTGCPILLACLETTLTIEAGADRQYRHGTFGGLTGPQRARLRPRAKLLAPCGTAGAARRHRRLGEPVDEACRIAALMYDRARRAAA